MNGVNLFFVKPTAMKLKSFMPPLFLSHCYLFMKQ
jgi:hypothetical protein